ncbi:MAG: pyridoxamine 5'-phosphate oxidase [Crocinitomicaceae bacterium]|tara:strand:- start:5701 stop:6348 length:648 start_codon:yes stop_codon:yes gene_type:complete
MSKHLDRLRDEHKDFDLNALSDVFSKDPFLAFQEWFDSACKSEQPEPNAVVLSTIDQLSMQPSSRVLYLKELRKKAFVFYTNYQSSKALEMESNPNVSLLFFWPGLQRQIRIQGVVTKIDPKESDAYFDSRPRSSQLGAWASEQSRVLKSREDLEQKSIEIGKEFPEKVERPDFWGGYAVAPVKFEFWQGRPSRLHDRIVFERSKDLWNTYRINP